MFDDHVGKLFQLTNYHQTVSLKSATQNENDGEFNQSIIVKPSLSQFFNGPKELQDSSLKHFLKDLQKQALKGVNYVEALHANKLGILQQMGLLLSEDEDFDGSAAVADPMKAYRGNAKCLVFYLEGDFSVVTNQSNLIIEWGRYSETTFKADHKVTFAYNDFTKYSSNKTSSVFVASMLWMKDDNSCEMSPIGLNLGSQCLSIMDAYKSGSLHKLLTKGK